MDMHNTAFRQDLYRYQTTVGETCATACNIVGRIHEIVADFYEKLASSDIPSPNVMRLQFLGNTILISAEVILSEPPIMGKILCRLEQPDGDKPILLKTSYDFDTLGNINGTLGASECTHELMQRLFAELKDMKCVVRQ